MIDLHIHSNFSDGKYKIDEIANIAEENNVSILSITDHDNIESVNYIKKNKPGKQVMFIPGVELSTESFYFGDKLKIHILGYGFDYKNVLLNERLQKLYYSRAIDNKEYIDQLILMFKFLSHDMFENFDYGKYGWLHKMILQQVSPIINENQLNILKQYIYLNRPKYHSYNIKVEEAIDIINKSNGYSVIAHPFKLNLSNELVKEFIRYLKEQGLLGVETYNDSANLEQMRFYHRIALDYDLLESCGSDFHLGEYNVIHNNFFGEENKLVRKLILENKTIGGNSGKIM